MDPDGKVTLSLENKLSWEIGNCINDFLFCLLTEVGSNIFMPNFGVRFLTNVSTNPAEVYSEISNIIKNVETQVKLNQKENGVTDPAERLEAVNILDIQIKEESVEVTLQVVAESKASVIIKL